MEYFICGMCSEVFNQQLYWDKKSNGWICDDCSLINLWWGE